MAISDYSTTPGSNTSISGINIGENCSPGNLNNATRQLMADIKTWYDTVAAGGTYQPLDALLTALADLSTSSNKGLYFTGSDTPALFDLTAFARTILDDADAATVRTTIGAMEAPAVSGSGSSGKITIGTFTVTWRDHFIGDGTASYTYGNSHTYSSWARAWVNCDDGSGDNSTAVRFSGLSSATVYSNAGETNSGTLFAIGV